VCDYYIESLDYFTCLTCFLTKGIDKIKPVRVYSSFKKDKLDILREQENKVGIYYLINLINGHDSVGSSVNLAGRIRNYLNNNFLKNKRNNNMPIVKVWTR